MDALLGHLNYWDWWILAVILLVFELLTPATFFMFMGIAAAAVGLRARPALAAAATVAAGTASLGLAASFLAKTTAREEGSSGHVHLSCWRGGGRNALPGGGAGRG